MWFNAQLSYQVAGHEHMGASNWNGRQSLYNTATYKFPAGFVRMCQKKLEREGYRVIVKSQGAPVPLGEESPKVDDFPEDPRYSYQPEVVRRLLSLKGMIAQVATGGGKSRIFKLAAERIGRPTLFVTTRKSLMYQMAEAYEKDIGKPYGVMGDGIWNPCPTGVNFAIVDTLISRIEEMNPNAEFSKMKERALEAREKKIREALKKHDLDIESGFLARMPAKYREPAQKKIDLIRKTITDKMPIDTASLREKAVRKAEKQNAGRIELLQFLSQIEFVCLEEAHEVSSNSYYAVMNACKNAHYRLALTATPFMKDDEEANMRLMACTGPIGIKVTEKHLIDLGILAKPFFKYEKYGRVKGLTASSAWQTAQTKGIVDNAERNQKIIDNCMDAKRHGLSAMVLVQLTRHGKLLEKQLKELGVKARFISGESKQVDRQAALNDLGAGRIDVLIGSTIMDVGVDCPSLGMVILAGGGKAEVSLRQRIGRGLRAKKNGPNVAFIVDFQDRYNKHLTKHARERRRIVEETPGFAENIVDNFDIASYGFRRAS